MSTEAHPDAGTLAPPAQLIDTPRLITAYYTDRPDPDHPDQRVSFGTSGHRGSALTTSFNQDHILAITQAIVEHRRAHAIDGPLYLGIDTHALSAPARATAIEVLAAQGVHVHIDAGDGFTPTPAVSRAILAHNAGRTTGLADGIIITPSHNPPQDGGFKYNPPSGGPASSATTRAIEDRANALLRMGARRITRMPLQRALRASTTHRHDFTTPYVNALGRAIDLDRIAASGVRIGVDPLGGASVHYWAPIADRYNLDLTVVQAHTDPTFRFMPRDRDGALRMDCSSPWAMRALVDLRDRFDIAFGNDPDADRHGIVTPTGLLNPNHYLAVAIDHLLTHRPHWSPAAKIGKTLVSSAILDRVVAAHNRPLYEVPVGFKWFAPGLASGDLLFGGEESAGASFLQRDGTPWTTDKDGLLLNLLAAEITATTGRDLASLYADLTARFGAPIYARTSTPATRPQRAALKRLDASAITATTLAGHAITHVYTQAPGNNAPIGGLKVTTDRGWFAARPSGTEPIAKLYAESFDGPDHLARIQAEAQALIDAATA